MFGPCIRELLLTEHTQTIVNVQCSIFLSLVESGSWSFLLSCLQDALRETDDHDIGPAISHFFNCFFGSSQAVGSKVAANSVQSRTPKKVCFIVSTRKKVRC